MDRTRRGAPCPRKTYRSEAAVRQRSTYDRFDIHPDNGEPMRNTLPRTGREVKKTGRFAGNHLLRTRLCFMFSVSYDDWECRIALRGKQLPQQRRLHKPKRLDGSHGEFGGSRTAAENVI